MKLIICDDTEEDVACLKEYIGTYFAGHVQELFVCSSGEELLQRRELSGFDLLFLDVYMKGMDGIAAARELRARGERGKIILATTARDFGAESYEIEAAWYLVKPFRYEGFERAMERCIQQQNKENAALQVHVKKDMLMIPASEIDYIETEGRRVLIHMGYRTLKVYDTLERLYGQLPDTEFIRPHRSYILRMGYIERLDGEQFVLKNGERVSINRSQRKEIRDMYHRYLFRALDGAERETERREREIG